MNLPHQIKTYRTKLSLSQEELAEKLYVTRQSISNWETGKCYPDLNSLLLMSSLFSVTLDQLVKGDIDMIKETIQKQDIKSLSRYTTVFMILMIVCIVSFAPLYHFFSWYGLILSGILAIGMLLVGFKLEKMKKSHDIQTYKEIDAFLNGKRLDEIQKQQEAGKVRYQHIFLMIGSAIFTFVIIMLIFYLLK